MKNRRFALPAQIAAEIALEVLEQRSPRGVNLLNVNFPWKTETGTKVKLTSIEVRKYRDYVIERKDPRGGPTTGCGGRRLPTFKKGSDVYAVHKEKTISISPLSLDLTPNVASRSGRSGPSWREEWE